jgi:nucleotide-binding universal stress UspA family protein
MISVIIKIDQYQFFLCWLSYWFKYKRPKIDINSNIVRKTKMFKKILLAVDSSEHSKNAVKAAADLAEKYGSELIILNTYYIPEHFNAHASSHYVYLRKIEENMVSHGKDFLATLKTELETKNIKVRVLQEKGPAGPVIIKISDSEECELVVVGSRGLGNVSSLIIGSVSNYVLHHAKCAVLLTK